MTITAQQGVFSFGLQAVPYGEGTVLAQKAEAKMVTAAVPANGYTVTIGSVTYTFKTALSAGPTVANEILRGATPDISIANLALAVNGGAGVGVKYSTGTVANADVDAESENYTAYLTAAVAGKAGNLLVLSQSGATFDLTAFAYGQSAETYDVGDTSFRKHRADDINYEAAQQQDGFPMEIGADDTPPGTYKSGVFLAGGATVQPRLESSMGDIFLGLMGSCDTDTDSPEAGLNTHTFKIAADKSIPWMTVRKHIPGKPGIREKGLTGYDNKVASMRIMVPQTGLVQARCNFEGRFPKWDNHPSSWLYGSDFESSPSAPLACKGAFKLPTISADEQPIVGLVVEWVNNLTGPREEFVTGSYFMSDIIVKSRMMSVMFTYKWADPELYERVYTGEVNGTDWSPEVFETEFDGVNYGFEASVESPANIPGFANPYSLTIRATRVSWEVASEVRMVGNGILSQDYRGTVLTPTDPTDPYAEFILVNEVDSYAIPVQS